MTTARFQFRSLHLLKERHDLSEKIRAAWQQQLFKIRRPPYGEITPRACWQIFVQLDAATPTQLASDRTEEDLSATQEKQPAKQACQQARQSSVAQNLRTSSKPLQPGDRAFYWQEDTSKSRSDGSKGVYG